MTQIDDRPATSPETVPTETTSIETIANTHVDVAWLGEYLLGDWAAARKHSRELLKDPAFHRIDGLSMDEHRTRTLGQLKKLVELKSVHRAFPTSLGGDNDHGANIA